jgi:hypothetical protein
MVRAAQLHGVQGKARRGVKSAPDSVPTGNRRHVHIDPAAVVAVAETERWPAFPAFGGAHAVAVITLATGDKYVVEDGARRAAKQIAEAQQAAAAGAEM